MRKHKTVTRRSRAQHRRKNRKVRKIQKKIVARKRHYRKKIAPIPVVTISETPKLPRRRRSSNGSQMYFTQETEDAIILYNKTEDSALREQIFREKILQPFHLQQIRWLLFCFLRSSVSWCFLLCVFTGFYRSLTADKITVHKQNLVK